MNAQHFSLDPSWDGVDWIFTLPNQLKHFRLAAIHFRIEGNGASARDSFIEITYGKVSVVWEVIFQNTTAATVVSSVNASPDIGQCQEVATASALYDLLSLLPLPSMTLDSQCVVKFGIRGGTANDIVDQGSCMIELLTR